MDRVKPIVIRDRENGIEYTLQFNRSSVEFTNSQGFKMSELMDNVETMLPILFYGAFRMHHRNIARSTTDKMLWEEISPVSQDFIVRLIDLYTEPRQALINDDPEAERKNPNMTVEL